MNNRLETWSFRYWLLKQYVTFANWIFHRQIVVRGKENIPENKPVVYAPNHQNALSDALSLVCTVPHQTIWLARADIFRTSVARFFLKFMKMIPVFRIRDGKDSLSENESTFAQSVAVLKKNLALGLFPEAAHSARRQMLPHKKAIPRIVFLAEEMTDFSLDIQIVPVGIFYDQYFNFGRRVMVTFGKPIQVLDYREKYLQNPQTATIVLRNDLQKALLSLVLNYETKTNYDGFEAIRNICSAAVASNHENTGSLPNRLESGRKIAATLDHLETSYPQQAQVLANNALELEKKLQSAGLRSWLIDKKEENPVKLFLHFLFLVLTFPFFGFGFIFNVAPFVILDRRIKKTVKQIIYKSSFSFGAGLLVFPLAYIIEMLIISPMLPGWIFKLLFLISLPFAGKFAFSWYILFLKSRGRWRWLRIKKINPELYAEIHRIKQDIIERLMKDIDDSSQ